jgi:hypothetical protein
VEEIKTRPRKVLVNSAELVVAPFDIPDRGPAEAPMPASISATEFPIRTESEFGGRTTGGDLSAELIDDLDLPAEYARQRTAPAGNPTG